MAKSPLVSFTFFCLLGLVFAMNAIGGGESAASQKKQATAHQEKLEWIKKISETYGQAKTLKVKVKKDLTYKYYGSPKSFEGQLVLKGEKLRLELMGQEHTLTLMQGDRVTQVTFPPKEDKEGKVRILDAILDKDAEAYKLLTSLLKGEGLQKSFKMVGSSKVAESTTYELVPLQESSAFSKVEINVTEDSGYIHQLSYLDNLGNKVSYSFTNTEFNKDVKDQIFEFKAPKNAERSTF